MNRYKNLLLLLTVFISLKNQAQTAASPDTLAADGKAFAKVDEEASFPGGSKAWVSFLSKNLGGFIPSENGAPYGKFTVIAQFIVDTDGSISGIKAITNFGYGMEDKVTGVLSKSGTWLPAILNGKPVKAYRRQPVTFIVSEDGFDLVSKIPYTLISGADNRITVEMDKKVPANLYMTISEGSIEQNDAEIFIARPTKPGRIVIDVFKGKNGRKMGSFSFEVKALADKPASAGNN
jgi:hypothetical protein